MSRSWHLGGAGSARRSRLVALMPAITLATSLALCLTLPPPAAATEAPRTTSNPALEAEVLKISAELRCLVCQNQTIADSHADLAIDLRNQVRTMLEKGQDKAQIIDFMTARYGDFVLYRPPVNTATALLWFGPAALLVLGVGVLVVVLRHRSRLSPERFEPDPEDV